MSSDRQALAKRALEKSLEVRSNAGIDFKSPICVYALCEQLKLEVRFVDISMEGLYFADSRRVMLSALRPLARRVFSCSHEIGHHVFGHRSTIDELQQATTQAFHPDEFLVDVFAGHLLMPLLGVRRAFSRRAWQPAMASPEQIFSIACNFGVGYETLVTHLAYGLRMITDARAEELRRVRPASIRRALTGRASPEPMVVMDSHYEHDTLDMEVGMQALMPLGTELDGTGLRVVADVAGGRIVQAERTGITLAQRAGGTAVCVRVSKFQYVGRSVWRHMEDNDDE